MAILILFFLPFAFVQPLTCHGRGLPNQTVASHGERSTDKEWHRVYRYLNNTGYTPVTVPSQVMVSGLVRNESNTQVSLFPKKKTNYYVQRGRSNYKDEGAIKHTVRMPGLYANVVTKSSKLVTVEESPTLSIISPEDNGIIEESNVTVEWVGLNVTTIRYYGVRVDNSSWVSVGTNTTYTSANLKDGQHTVVVKLVTENSSYTDAATFYVDTLPPSLWINSFSGHFECFLPDGCALLPPIGIGWVGTDKGSGIEYYEVKRDNKTWINVGKNTSYEFTGNMSDGDHRFYVKAVDRSGKRATVYITFTIDAQKPTIEIITPESGAELTSSKVVVYWNGSDKGEGIDHYELRLDHDCWRYVPGEGFPRHVFTGLSDGEHTIELMAVDEAGRWNIAAVTFTVNTSPIAGPGLLEELAIVGAGVAIVVIVVVLYFKKWKKE